MATTQENIGTASLYDLPLARALGENWWLLLLRGLVGIAFGILAFAWPGLTLLTLVIFWGAFTGADGILSLIAAFSGKGEAGPRWWLILVGLAGIAAGVIAFVWPGIAAGALLLLIAIWAIVVGIMQVIGGIALRKEIRGEFWLILTGLLSIAFGAAILYRPDAGALAIIWLIGAYAIAWGVILTILSFRMKGLKRAS